jgi:hypothetical protein
MTADSYPAPVPLGIAQLREIALEFRLRALRGQANAASIADALDALIRARQAGLTLSLRERERGDLSSTR